MKIAAIILLTASLLAESKAQFVVDTLPWCPPGATWTYKSFSPTSQLFYKFAYEKDSILQSRAVKVLFVYRIQYVGIGFLEGRQEDKIGQEYLYESNDSIYWYDKVNDTFSFLYSFNPVVGSQFIASNSRAYCLSDSTYPAFDTLFVTSQHTDTFSNRIFNTYEIRFDRKFRLGPIVSKIGSLTSPFPVVSHAFCDYPKAEYGDFYEGGLCYSDSLRETIQFHQWGGHYDCHSIATSVREPSVRELWNGKENRMGIYPNPADNLIHLSVGDKKIKQVSIHNTLGSPVLNDYSQNLVVNVSQFSSGLYVIRIVDTENKVSTLKFLKK